MAKEITVANGYPLRHLGRLSFTPHFFYLEHGCDIPATIPTPSGNTGGRILEFKMEEQREQRKLCSRWSCSCHITMGISTARLHAMSVWQKNKARIYSHNSFSESNFNKYHAHFIFIFPFLSFQELFKKSCHWLRWSFIKRHFLCGPHGGMRGWVSTVSRWTLSLC